MYSRRQDRDINTEGSCQGYGPTYCCFGGVVKREGGVRGLVYHSWKIGALTISWSQNSMRLVKEVRSSL